MITAKRRWIKMPRYLLTTDWHLDDNPQNEYRWIIFEHVRTALMQYEPDAVFHLGDIVDRRDRFSSALVNRLITELRGIAARAPVWILRGNHDTTLRRPNYLEFINGLDADVSYVFEPRPYDRGLLLLPYSAHPKSEWADLGLRDYRAVFMHATVTGARVENGQVMENSEFPMLPGRVKFYSGDVHVQQTVRNVTYVGAPHPIKFGDDYPCRMLLLDSDYGVALEIPLSGPRKLLLEVSGSHDLDSLDVRGGDQVRLRVMLEADRVGGWRFDDSAVARWADARGVTVAGVEVTLRSVHHDGLPGQDVQAVSAPDRLRRFAALESISDELLAIGLALLDEAR